MAEVDWMMKNFLLAFAVLFVLGTLAVAQTYDQNQGTAAPSSMNNAQSNGISQASGNDPVAQQAEETDLNSPNFTHQDFRGTELERAYQQEAQSGWQNPNLTKSAGIDGPGGQ
jgi:hypothetical protein